jgi:hypothetical protein
MAKGRLPKHVEFVRLLADLFGYDSRGDYAPFAKRLGKSTPNVYSYYNGIKIPGRKVLLSALRHAFEWEVRAIAEVQPIDLRSLTAQPGVYCLYDSSGSIIYVGQATNLKQEVRQALSRKMNFPVRRGPQLSKKAHPKYQEIALYLSAYEVPSPRMRHNLEALLLRSFPNQSHNNKMGNFR